MEPFISGVRPSHVTNGIEVVEFCSLYTVQTAEFLWEKLFQE